MGSSTSLDTPHFLESDDFDAMACYDIVKRIGHIVGTNETHGNTLKKATMNSAHAYLTGEFYASPERLGTERSPPTPRMRRGLAAAAGAEPTEAEVAVGGGEDGDGEDDDDDASEPAFCERPFRKGELVQIAEALVESDDMREWTPGGPDGA